ncbi:MAG: hypothetical protein AB8B86_13000 [Pseudomonadales bacterium]
MPDQIQIAIALLILLFVVEYFLGMMPGNPFKSLKINGNVLKFQRSAMARQFSIQKSSIRQAVVTPGHISLTLDENYGNRVLNLNYEKKYTPELYHFLQSKLTTTSFEYLSASEHKSTSTAKTPFGLVK